MNLFLKQFIRTISLLLVFLFCSNSLVGAENAFSTRLLQKKSIPQPTEPFVLIFFQTGSDNDRYGFVSDGAMSGKDWQQAFEHVGYLSPYSAFKPKDERQWDAHGQDVGLRAAQAINRQNGGCIMGLPVDADQQRNTMRALTNGTADKMTHFFHDFEEGLGTPGGSGKWRIRKTADHNNSLVSKSSEDFSTDAGKLMENFTLSFGIFLGDNIFGGKSTIIASENADKKNGWQVELRNEGGFSGKNYIAFTTAHDQHVQSLPLNVQQATSWNNVKILTNESANKDNVMVEITVEGVGTNRGIVPRPSFNKNFLVIGFSGNKHSYDIDDIMITTESSGKPLTIAHYDFEREDAATTKQVSFIKDIGGRGHHLTPAESNNPASFKLYPTTGYEPETAETARSFLIAPITENRVQKGLPQPLLITNWRLSDVRGRFAAWKNIGFTNGSTEYYLYDDFDNLKTLLENRNIRTQWAWVGGSFWTHAWLGNVRNDAKILPPEDYKTLITMAVLQGNRWFSVFTSMSDGHLAKDSDSKHDKAVINADALYNMALAASWFQATADGLRESVYLEDKPLAHKGDRGLFYARQNQSTKEMWFAGFLPQVATMEQTEKLEVQLSSHTGMLTDLSTGEELQITYGIFTLSAGKIAHPYYFKPDPP